MHLQSEFPSHSELRCNSGATVDRALSTLRAEGHAFRQERPLKIQLIVEASAGGTGRHVLDLAEGYVQRGHNVHLVHSTIRIDKLFQERLSEIEGISCLALPIRTQPHPADWSTIRTIRRFCAEHGPFDIVHGHSSKGGALARLVAMGTQAKAFYTVHGLNSMDPGMSRFKHLVYVSIERMLARITDGIITVSPEEMREAHAIGFETSKVRTIPNGLGNLELAPRSMARSAIGVSERHVVIGFVGRLVEQKAPEVLLKAFALAAAFNSNARLAIVGDGPLRNSLVELSVQLGIVGKIIWLGERDAREILAGFDLFAIASRKEGLPYVVLEAMWAGLPVVATSTAGVEILIEPGLNGTVVPPEDVPALGQAMVELLLNPPLLARYGATSRSLVGSFTADGMVEKTLGFYMSKLKRAAEPQALSEFAEDDAIPSPQ